MVFNDQGKIDAIVPVVRNDAHRLIEECMLAANVCAFDFLAEHRQTCLYRVHEGTFHRKTPEPALLHGRVRPRPGGGDDPKARTTPSSWKGQGAA